MPSAIVWHGETPMVAFSRVAPQALVAPFLHEPLASGVLCDLRPLDALGHDGDLRLVGAIHHMTRCGSTLLCRQFGAVDRVVALSEPFLFQQLLEGPRANPTTTRRRVRRLVAAWRDGLAPIADRMIVKWPSLLGQHAAILAAALPEVPGIFLYRDPIEVLASIAAVPLGRMNGILPRHLGEASAMREALPRDRLERSARVIAQTCRLAGKAGNLRSVDYATLPHAGWTSVAAYFGQILSARDVAAMQRASIAHSKDVPGGRSFAPDGAAKRLRSDARLERLTATIAPALAQLRRLAPSLTPPHPDEPDAGV